MHRKPYLTMGTLLYSLAFILYSFSEHDSVVKLAMCIFFGTMGLIQLGYYQNHFIIIIIIMIIIITIDVMADTMCVERSKFEPEYSKGQMQASCYSIRFGGSLIGALLGTVVCNKEQFGWSLSFKQISFLNGFIPFLLVTPWLFTLKERYKQKKPLSSSIQLQTISKESLKNDQKTTPSSSLLVNNSNINTYSTDVELNNNDDDDESNGTHSIYKQLNDIWETVQLQAVWRPMAFVYIFNIMQIPNVAWQSYLQLSLHFEAWILGLTVIIGSFMTFAGILAYKYIFFRTSWRKIYVWSVCLTTFFSLLQLCLIFQVNTKYFHLNNYMFSLGDDVIQAYISGIQFLPVCIMYTRLCPSGAEGASYSMLTTFGNIALTCASNLGNLLSTVWDVTNEAMRANNVDGLWKLTVVTSLLSTLPLSLLFLLPKNAEEQDQLAKSPVRSKIGGTIFLLILFGSLSYSIGSALHRLTLAYYSMNE